MCFSFDGWALAVGHEGALTVWSTEDGTRLVCTTSDSRGDGGGGGGRANAASSANSDGDGKLRGAEGETDTGGPPPSENQAPSPTGRARATGETTAGGRAAVATAAPSPAAVATSGTLDLVAGGASALTWECEGYRLMSVGGAVLGGGTSVAGEEGKAGVQGIVAFDFLRRARSNLSSALLSLQVILGVPRFSFVFLFLFSFVLQVGLIGVGPVRLQYFLPAAPYLFLNTYDIARGLYVWRVFIPPRPPRFPNGHYSSAMSRVVGILLSGVLDAVGRRGVAALWHAVRYTRVSYCF